MPMSCHDSILAQLALPEGHADPDQDALMLLARYSNMGWEKYCHLLRNASCDSRFMISLAGGKGHSNDIGGFMRHDGV